MAVDGCAAVSKSEVIAGLCYLAEVCSGRIAVEVSEVVKSARGMEVESVTVTKRLFEPTGALRAYELMGLCLGLWQEGSLEPSVDTSGEGVKDVQPALVVPVVGEGWSETGYSPDAVQDERNSE